MQSRIIDNGEAIVSVTSQDVEPILDFAKARHNEGMHGSSDVKHVAELPMVAVENYIASKGITFAQFCESQEHIRAMVNDPALNGFRIWPGRV